MIWSMLGKVVGTAIGLAFLLWWPVWPVRLYVGAFLLGAAPIWLELFATQISGVEPSLENRRGWRLADAGIDAFSFLLAPTIWMGGRVLPRLFLFESGRRALTLALLVFLVAGLYRFGRFLRDGLAEGEYFDGLPVTYTGYLWAPWVYLARWGWVEPAVTVLGFASLAMVWKGLRIRRTHTRHDAS